MTFPMPVFSPVVAQAGGGNDANTVVLIQNEGETDGSTTITNTAVGGSATFTASGGATVDIDVPVNGNPSLVFVENSYVQFDASGAELTFGSGDDFTIEFFVQTTTKSLDGAFQRRLFDFGGSHLACFLGASATGQVEIDTPTGFKGTSDIGDGNLHHVAIMRASGTLMIIVDGTAENSVANSSTFTGEATAYFGRYQPSNNGNFIGNLGQIRISNVARYSPPFTPPSEPFG